MVIDKSWNKNQLYESKQSKLADEIRRLLCLSSKSSLLQDRVEEYSRIFKIPINMAPKMELMARFEGNKYDDDRLFQTINKNASDYVARKYLFPTVNRLIDIKRIRDSLTPPYQPNTSIRVLDYGCGAADPALICAQNGDFVSICDIGHILDTAMQRFALRGLPVSAFKATKDESIKNCGNCYDLIICEEVLEHVRDPIALLEYLDHAANKNAAIVLGSFPFTPTNDVGDHLSEAVSARSRVYDWILDIGSLASVSIG